MRGLRDLALRDDVEHLAGNVDGLGAGARFHGDYFMVGNHAIGKETMSDEDWASRIDGVCTIEESTEDTVKVTRPNGMRLAGFLQRVTNCEKSSFDGRLPFRERKRSRGPIRRLFGGAARSPRGWALVGGGYLSCL